MTAYANVATPEELTDLLARLKAEASQSKHDSSDYILYQDHALLRIDGIGTASCQAWFYDLNGRPALESLRNIIKQVTEKFIDKSRQELYARNPEFFSASGGLFRPARANHSIEEALQYLQNIQPESELHLKKS